MTEDWEYEEEAIQAEAERLSRERYMRMPGICRRCRWLDWYHLKECSHHRWPENGRCALFSRALPYFKPRWLWLGAIGAQYRWWQVRTWRYWQSEKHRYRPMGCMGCLHRFYNLRMYVRKLRLGRQARAWLRGNGAERTAAYCMFYLNRHARGSGEKKHLIYQFKNHLVRLFYEQGLCTQTTLQVQQMECWDCNGTGEDCNDNLCMKCGGTGVYRQHQLYRLVFDVQGRRYVWHQPKGLVTFPVRIAMAGMGEYRAERNGYALDQKQRELYMMVVWEYLRAHGVTERDVNFRFPTLGSSLRADWLNSKMRRRWRKRTDGVRTLWGNAKRLCTFVKTGEMPALEDEIPF